MNLYKRYIKKIIIILISVIIFTQIIIGFFWMIRNFGSVPAYGDTPEYLKLSETLALDEYREILYPLFLKIIIYIANKMSIPYQVPVYILQSIVCYAVLLNFFNCLVSILEKNFPKRFQNIKYKKIFIQLFTLYIFTIPLIMHYNLTILTDSFALSLLIVLITYLIRFLQEDCFTIAMVCGMVLSVVLQSLIRSDRLYSSILLIGICCMDKIIKLAKRMKKYENKKIHRQIFSKVGMVIIASILITGSINASTQIPGLYNRPKINFEFVLLERIVWPHMTSNYEKFSDEVKGIISYDMAVKFDSHNNNVMYLVAPAMEKSVGKEQASKLYLEMAKVVFKNQSEKIFFDISKDITTFLCFPITICADSNGYSISVSDWNYTRMAEAHGMTTMYYYKFSMYSFILIIIPLLIYMWTRKNSFTRECIYIIRPIIWSSIILALWFSIGLGSPPNSRYALIVFMCWGVAGLVSYFDLCTE